MLVDTNIFIDFLKGKPEAVNFFREESELITSQFVVMEVIDGLANKRAIAKFEILLQKTHITVIPITEEISKRAYLLFIRYVLSIRIDIADTFIAATAIVYNQNSPH